MTLDLAIITDSLSPAAGGLFESVRLPANKLAAGGARVAVYGVRDAAFEAARPAWQGPELTAFGHIGPRRLALSPALLRRVLASDHQVLHQHGIWQFPSYVTEHWRRRTGRPTIISPRGMLDPWAVKQSRLRKSIVRKLYEDANLRNATAIHALNASEAEAIRAFGLTNPIAIIPNGVDLPTVVRSPIHPDTVREDGRRDLLFLGRLHPKKGVAELIEAWVRLLDEAPYASATWRVVIAGWDDGGLGEALKAQVEARGLAGHIAFTGALHGAAKAAALATAAAFVLPSRSEGMPMAVLEAWSYGVPVFMTRECNLMSAFDDGAAIEISTDPAAMAKTFAACLDQATLLAQVGAAGRRVVEQSFTWDRVVSDMRRLYAWAITGDAPPEFMV